MYWLDLAWPGKPVEDVRTLLKQRPANSAPRFLRLPELGEN